MKITLIINTADKEKMYLALENNKKIISDLKIKAKFKQAQKLLTGIDILLKKNNFNISDINKIKVADSGNSFTSLRIGVVTANALAFALNAGINDLPQNKGHKLNIIKPRYDTEPNIKIKKNMV